MKTIDVKIEKIINNSYEIEIGYNLFGKLVYDITQGLVTNVHKYAIVTDSNVAGLYGYNLLNLMIKQGLSVEMYTIPAGEKSKTRENKAELEDKMLEAGFRKDSCIIALGGGVVTDLAGFLAATYCRGIPVINYATSFLAAADASIGGKTAVDTPFATNMIGLIVQPRKVYIDLKTWETLGEDQIQNGLSETIKHACIADINFFDYLVANIDTVKERNRRDKMYLDILEYICQKNIEIKYNIVTQDEQEEGLRETLNLGHTVGRAIEAASGYEISHGNAVSLGMVAQILLGYNRGYVTDEQKNRVIEIYNKAGLPTALGGRAKIEKILDKMYADKKVRKGKIKFVFQKGIGDMMVFGEQFSDTVDGTEIEEVLRIMI
ncbi:MAG: 3-dehydroquinate synthase [Lachnospiraceae bacterium]|nr:3-dehydroquinate synthase [Lachnospiraceae bacterium]